MGEKRYGVEVTGICRICGRVGYTEMHHIISQHRCKKIGKPEWINNPGNIVELCKLCHDDTTASISWEMNNRRKIRTGSGARTTQPLIVEGGGDTPHICWAMLKSGKRRCRKKAKPNGHNLCSDHYKLIHLGLPPHKSQYKFNKDGSRK